MPILKITGLEKKYATGDLALRGVDLSIDAGEIVAIIGPSGAGKSSLIRCVNRLVEPTAGSIEIDGIDVVSLSGSQLREQRSRIGMIFQSFALVDRLSVMENVLCGALSRTGFWASWFRKFAEGDVDRALTLLEKVGLSDHVNKRADALSGGQRQRVGIARALLQKPLLLLADEPTASLDPKTSKEVMTILRELVTEEGLTTIVNLHDVPLAKACATRIVGLSAGKVVFDGPPSELTEAVWETIYGEPEMAG
ncbi:MAG: phosphonate ABC transporter ATP-binding protein [Verrucomicrobiales bacterium]|nr:phosphonate ABC transporter ATP-binding protein [Verrucomicrobiales bacterium]